MSYRTLTFLQMLRLYYREAAKITGNLPKGCVRLAYGALRKFIEAEKETLRRWYYALQMHLLGEKEFGLLLGSIKERLKLKALAKKGIHITEIKTLQQNLLALLQELSVEYSCTDLPDDHPGYKVRLYTLPEPGMYRSPDNEELPDYN